MWQVNEILSGRGRRGIECTSDSNAKESDSPAGQAGRGLFCLVLVRLAEISFTCRTSRQGSRPFAHVNVRRSIAFDPETQTSDNRLSPNSLGQVRA